MDDSDMILPTPRPHLDEHYMSTDMLAYFKDKLLTWRQEVDHLITTDRQALQNREPRQADELDEVIVAQLRVNLSQQLSRHHQLRLQIDAALERMDKGCYGYCEQSGEPIGFKRLDAWPIAELSLKAQAFQEHRVKLERIRQLPPLW